MSVYFILVDKYVKIGYSYRPEQRMKSLFGGGHLICPADLDKSSRRFMLRVVEGGRIRDEIRLHEMFEEFHVAGEWYHATHAFLVMLADLDYVTVEQERLNARRAKLLAAKQVSA